MVLKYVCFIDKEVYFYKLSKDQFIPLKYEDSIYYKGDLCDIGTWFKNTSGYIDGKSKLDLTIVKFEKSDIELDFKCFDTVEKTSWTLSQIKSFVREKTPKSILIVHKKYVEVINRDIDIADTKSVFYNVLFYPECSYILSSSKIDEKTTYKIIDIEEKKEEVEEIVENETPLSRYYRQKTLEIKNNK
ncbi:MAG: hypothetical protein R3Y64_05565 [Peptostreptococcaceae bacterium]